jgi:peptide/nickel transport system permease protein
VESFGAIGGIISESMVYVALRYYLVHTHLLLVAITLALQRFWQVFVAGILMWVEVAHVALYGQVISVKEMQYVTAARALGFWDFNILIISYLKSCASYCYFGC